MNQDQVEGRWTQFTGYLREKWGQLTDDDIAEAKGDRDQLIGKIQARTGDTRESIAAELDRLSARQ